MAGKGRIKDVWREQQIFEQRALIAGVLIALLTGALIARLGWLQISRGEERQSLRFRRGHIVNAHDARTMQN